LYSRHLQKGNKIVAFESATLFERYILSFSCRPNVPVSEWKGRTEFPAGW